MFLFHNTLIHTHQNYLFTKRCCTLSEPDPSLLNRSLAFIKTHKTGSTTVKLVLARLAQLYHLRAMPPPRGHEHSDGAIARTPFPYNNGVNGKREA
jgi:hypothetical protein